MSTIWDVYWEGPYSFADVIAPASTIALAEHVLYQLEGTHPVYGAGKLLYVGMTERETPRPRLNEHWKTWVRFEPDEVKVRLASVGVFPGWTGWMNDAVPRYPAPTQNKLVTMIEHMLIYAHQPAFNSKGLLHPPNGFGKEDTRLFNSGRYGSLFPEVSVGRYRDLPRAAHVEE